MYFHVFYISTTDSLQAEYLKCITSPALHYTILYYTKSCWDFEAMIGRLSPSGEYRQHCTASNHPFQAKPMFHSHFSAPSGRLYSIHSFLSRHVQVLMISFMTSALSQLGSNMNSENAALPKLQLLLKKKTKTVYCSQTLAGRTDSTELKYSQNFWGFPG